MAKRTRKHKRYTDDFRADAVLWLEAAGYPDTEGALARVSRELGVPHQTLGRWYRSEQNPPPHEIVQEKKRDFLEQLARIKGLAAIKIEERIEEYDPRDLTGLLKISAELEQLLMGKPTHRTEHLSNVLEQMPQDEYEAIVKEAEEVISSSSESDNRD